MAINFKKIWQGLGIVPKTSSTSDSKGELEVIDSSGKLNYHNGTSNSPIVTEAHSATLTNKTIDADDNTISDLELDNLKAGVLNTSTSLASASNTQVPSALAVKTYVDNSSGAVQTDVDDLVSLSGVAANATTLGTFTGTIIPDNQTNKQAIQALETFAETDATNLANHISNATDAHDASAISVVPTGNLAADDVQEALVELQTDVDTRATSSALTAHTGASANVHGLAVGSSVVGTTDSQALTNKTITGADIRTPVRSDVKQDTKANLTTYAITASNGQLAFATDTKEMFQVVDGLLESVGGGEGIGGVDILFTQTFETAALADFTQTGLSLSTSAPLHGEVSALLTHQPATSQSFKQVIAVDRKFRSQSMVMRLNVKSNASAGNVVLSVYDETNAANLVASEQLQLSNDVNGELNSVGFTIPETCASLSYTITALQEAGSPVTRVDDIIAELAVTALLETSVEVPVVETQTSRISQSASFGNADITGAVTSSTGSGVYSYNSGTGVYTVIKNAQFDISATFRANGAASVQPLICDSSGSVEYATDTSLASAAARANASGSFYLAAGSTFKIRNALAGTTNEQYISVNAVYTSSTTKVIPLTQSGLVQNPDSYIRLYGANGYGSTATKIPRLATVDKSLGSDVLYQDSAINGASFTIQTAGIYDIALSFDSSPQSQIGLSLNSSQLTTNVNAISIASRLAYGVNTAGFGSTVSHSGYFNAGDVIRPHTDGAAISALSNFSISKQSSLKQVTVNPNSKMTLPSSELRMEGITGRGSTDTRVIQYSAISAIRGDAFTVVSNAVNGTIVTITKAGKISINANAQIAAGELFISRNQAVLTSNPVASETLGYSFSPSSADAQNVGFAGTVRVGDILRITSSSAPSASSGNLLTILHEETSIGVAVSNTLPQFSESDSSVRVAGSNGFGSTNTQNVRFSNVLENIGGAVTYSDSATNGMSCLINEDGLYSFSTFGSSGGTSTDDLQMEITKNAVQFVTPTDSSSVLAYGGDRVNTSTTNTKFANPAGQAYLVKGDVIRVAANTSVAGSQFFISKVGKPNVTGVNVTPFVNIPQPISDRVRVSAIPSDRTAQIQYTPADVSITSNGVLRFEDDPANTRSKFVALVECNAFVSFSGAVNTVGNYVTIYKNGSLWQEGAGVVSNGARTTTSANLKLVAGDFITVGSTTTTNAGDPAILDIYAEAKSPSILTAPETFSTDTASLTYAGSATYTLSTLANAPVGTFITYTLNASSVRTQTTTAPTQTTSDMTANGINLFTKLSAATSTAGNPASIAIQIGKGMKGVSLSLFKNTAKTTAGGLDFFYVPGSSAQIGLNYQSYNPTTGVLVLEPGGVASTTTTSVFQFEDLSTQSNGYFVINASKNPALTGINSSVCAGRVVSSSGQTITNGTPTKITWNSPTFVQNITWDSTNSRFVAQVAGTYQIDSSITQTRSWTAGQQTGVRIYKNGSLYSGGAFGVAWAAFNGEFGQSVSDVVNLAAGDYVEIYGFMVGGAGNSTLIANASFNYFSISKVGGLG